MAGWLAGCCREGGIAAAGVAVAAGAAYRQRKVLRPISMGDHAPFPTTPHAQLPTNGCRPENRLLGADEPVEVHNSAPRKSPIIVEESTQIDEDRNE